MLMVVFKHVGMTLTCTWCGGDADLHGNGAHLHGAGNGQHKHTLIDMVIVAPAKCMHKTYLQGGGNSLFQ